ncbi:hypothetical protein [Litchfieldella xinjiangensis]|uniref:hypothetical protein n=1 Tax=Litchfieldella xinjiangensis TaxID=1166948 RepID=UPI0005BA0054|nr:hypothetical protein [Halomonas xinjiangensis]
MINIHPLPGHPLLIPMEEATRAPSELIASSRQMNTGAEDVLLTHPPILLRREGGGEQLLNHDSVASQLDYQRGHRATALPASLRVWIIDPGINDETILLFAFLFGPVQRLQYKKKEGRTPSWKRVMQRVEQDPLLKAIIENHLFDSEEMAPRHYRLLMGSLVGESSINHELGRIRAACVKDKSTAIKTVAEAAGQPLETPPAEVTPPAQNNNGLSAALNRINQAATRGAEQFSRGLDMEAADA